MAALAKCFLGCCVNHKGTHQRPRSAQATESCKDIGQGERRAFANLDKESTSGDMYSDIEPPKSHSFPAGLPPPIVGLSYCQRLKRSSLSAHDIASATTSCQLSVSTQPTGSAMVKGHVRDAVPVASSQAETAGEQTAAAHAAGEAATEQSATCQRAQLKPYGWLTPAGPKQLPHFSFGTASTDVFQTTVCATVVAAPLSTAAAFKAAAAAGCLQDVTSDVRNSKVDSKPVANGPELLLLAREAGQGPIPDQDELNPSCSLAASPCGSDIPAGRSSAVTTPAISTTTSRAVQHTAEGAIALSPSPPRQLARRPAGPDDMCRQPAGSIAGVSGATSYTQCGYGPDATISVPQYGNSYDTVRSSQLSAQITMQAAIPGFGAAAGVNPPARTASTSAGTPRLTVYSSLAAMLADLSDLRPVRQAAAAEVARGLRGAPDGCVYMRGRLPGGTPIVVHLLGCRALHPATAPLFRTVMLAGSAIHPAIARVYGMRFVPSAAVVGAGLAGVHVGEGLGVGLGGVPRHAVGTGRTPDGDAPTSAAAAALAPETRDDRSLPVFASSEANRAPSSLGPLSRLPSWLQSCRPSVSETESEAEPQAEVEAEAEPDERAPSAAEQGIAAAAAAAAAADAAPSCPLASRLLQELDLQPGEGVLAVVCEGSNMGNLEFLLNCAHNPFRPSRSWPAYMARRTLLRTAMEVAGALAYLHSRGIVHGALRPCSVLLAPASTDRRNFRAKVVGASVRFVKLLGSGHSAAAVAVADGNRPGGVGPLGGSGCDCSGIACGGGDGGSGIPGPRSASSPQPHIPDSLVRPVLGWSLVSDMPAAAMGVVLYSPFSSSNGVATVAAASSASAGRSSPWDSPCCDAVPARIQAPTGALAAPGRMDDGGGSGGGDAGGYGGICLRTQLDTACMRQPVQAPGGGLSSRPGSPRPTGAAPGSGPVLAAKAGAMSPLRTADSVAAVNRRKALQSAGPRGPTPRGAATLPSSASPRVGPGEGIGSAALLLAGRSCPGRPHSGGLGGGSSTGKLQGSALATAAAWLPRRAPSEGQHHVAVPSGAGGLFLRQPRRWLLTGQAIPEQLEAEAAEVAAEAADDGPVGRVRRSRLSPTGRAAWRSASALDLSSHDSVTEATAGAVTTATAADTVAHLRTGWPHSYTEATISSTTAHTAVAFGGSVTQAAAIAAPPRLGALLRAMMTGGRTTPATPSPHPSSLVPSCQIPGSLPTTVASTVAALLARRPSFRPATPHAAQRPLSQAASRGSAGGGGGSGHESAVRHPPPSVERRAAAAAMGGDVAQPEVSSSSYDEAAARRCIQAGPLVDVSLLAEARQAASEGLGMDRSPPTLVSRGLLLPVAPLEAPAGAARPAAAVGPPPPTIRVVEPWVDPFVPSSRPPTACTLADGRLLRALNGKIPTNPRSVSSPALHPPSVEDVTAGGSASKASDLSAATSRTFGLNLASRPLSTGHADWPPGSKISTAATASVAGSAAAVTTSGCAGSPGGVSCSNLGSPCWRDALFVSPEANSHPHCRADASHDTWSFGMLLWSMVSGSGDPNTGPAAVADADAAASAPASVMGPVSGRQASSQNTGHDTCSRLLSTLELELGVRAPPWPAPAHCKDQFYAPLRPLYEACVALDPTCRPPMAQVLTSLERLERRLRADHTRQKQLMAAAAAGGFMVVQKAGPD